MRYRIWVCWFILTIQSSINQNMIYYAYADFASAPQITQAYVVSTIVGSILQLAIAKTLDLCGRFSSFLLSSSSVSRLLPLAAGYTLYSIGYTSVSFILNIFIADKKSSICIWVCCNTFYLHHFFVGSLAAQSFLKTLCWR